MCPVLRLVLGGTFCAAVGVAGTLVCVRRPSTVPPVTPLAQTPQPSPVQRLLDALTRSAKSGNPDQVTRYTQALSALGSEALPEIKQRLQYDNLPTEVLAAYASALIEAGGEQALPDLRAFWDRPRGRGEGLKVKQPVILALIKRRSPEIGQALLDFWLLEQDPEVQTLLAQALKTNTQVNGPLIAKAWEQARDEPQKRKLWTLMLEGSAQGQQQEEARALSAMKAGTPETRQTLKGILERPGATNKATAIAMLEQDGGAEALRAILDFAKGRETEVGLRYQALVALCRRADTGLVGEITAWHEQAPGIRPNVLNAVANSANPAFKPWVEEQLSQAEDPQLKTRLKFARDQLVIAKNRRDLRMKP